MDERLDINHIIQDANKLYNKAKRKQYEDQSGQPYPSDKPIEMGSDQIKAIAGAIVHHINVANGYERPDQLLED